jgi:hypothetical protein
LFVIRGFPVDINTLAPKVAALKIGSKTQNDIFIESGCNDFDQISAFYGEHPHK